MTSTAGTALQSEECSACGGLLDALGHCAKCGAAYGEAYRCPLCSALADVEGDPRLSYRCRACGGPRIPPTASPISESEIQRLRAARSEQSKAFAFRAGSAFALASGALSFLVTGVVLLATSPAPFAELAALLACLVPCTLALFAFRQARRHARRLEDELNQAWFLAASRLAAFSSESVTAASLAKALRIDEARAELLLAEVSVQDFVQTRSVPERRRLPELAEPAERSVEAERADVTSSVIKS